MSLKFALIMDKENSIHLFLLQWKYTRLCLLFYEQLKVIYQNTIFGFYQTNKIKVASFQNRSSLLVYFLSKEPVVFLVLTPFMTLEPKIRTRKTTQFYLITIKLFVNRQMTRLIESCVEMIQVGNSSLQLWLQTLLSIIFSTKHSNFKTWLNNLSPHIISYARILNIRQKLLDDNIKNSSKKIYSKYQTLLK